MRIKLTEEIKKELTQIKKGRFNYLINVVGFNKHMPNKFAALNRATYFAFANKELQKQIGVLNGLCTLHKDIIECEDRAIHYGLAVGDVLKTIAYPLNWLNAEVAAALLKEIRNL